MQTQAQKVAPLEHQLLLTPSNVALTLSNDKTETRRLMRPMPAPTRGGVEYRLSDGWDRAFARWIEGSHQKVLRCPYGRPGDTLWCRETWQLIRAYDDGELFQWHGKVPKEHPGRPWQVVYAADGHPGHIDDRGWTWRPNIFMPRWACRLRLRVEEIVVEQLHDITEAGARAEGMLYHDGRGVGHSGWRHDPSYGFVSPDPISAYARQWDLLHPKAKWDDVNPFVWVVKYSRVEP